MTLARSRPASRAPSRRRPEETRQRILAAARDGFASLGFDGVTTRDIASRARANQGLVSYYFGSKEKLWKAVIEELFADLQATLARQDSGALTPHDPEALRARLREVVRQFVRFSATHPELHRLIGHEGKSGGPRMRWLVDRHVRPLYESALGMAKAAQTAGLAPRVPPAYLIYALIGAGTHLFTVAPEFRRLSGIDPTDPAAVEAHADALIALIFPGASS